MKKLLLLLLLSFCSINCLPYNRQSLNNLAQKQGITYRTYWEFLAYDEEKFVFDTDPNKMGQLDLSTKRWPAWECARISLGLDEGDYLSAGFACATPDNNTVYVMAGCYKNTINKYSAKTVLSFINNKSGRWEYITLSAACNTVLIKYE